MTDLATIATELYALLPSEFTAARNERARAATGELAASVRALRKPSPAAWATNLLVRERTDEVAQLLALGDALRTAQSARDRAALTELGTQRRALISALARQAGSLTADAGHAVNAAALVEVEQTLQAALTDASAAAAATSGRLTRALSTDGLEPVDIENAVAGPLPEVRAHPVAAAKKPTKRELEKRERERQRADDRIADAQRAADDAATAKRRLERERSGLRERLAEIEALLAEATRVADKAEREVTAAKRAR